jgi:hypothetical protein
VANDVKERISGTTPESVLAAMQSFAKATAQISLSDTNAAAYIQSSVDMGTLYLRGASEEVNTINEMRRMVRDRRNAFGQPIVTLAAERPREGGIALTLEDLEHLLIDAGRDGWLVRSLRLRCGCMRETYLPM